MLATIIISLVIFLALGAALTIGQFFGREPITPKCNPDTCCMQDEDCAHRPAMGPRRV